MNPHYYLMNSKKILRLEEGQKFEDLPKSLQEYCLDSEACPMDQDQANWRVVIFRDEIMELDEYSHWISTSTALNEEEDKISIYAN